jgi:AcrR family transcriptional regulator
LAATTQPSDPLPASRVASRIKDGATLSAGRDRLLAGARKCFAKKGYGGTSVQDIADAAGISIGSFYKYVRAKEDLLWLMAETSHAGVRDVIDGAFARPENPLDGIRVVVDALIRHADRDRDLMSLLYAEFKYMPGAGKKLILEQERSLLDRIVAMIRAGNRAGVYHCPNPELVALDIEMFGSTWVLKSHMIGLSIEDYIAGQIVAAMRLVGVSEDDITAFAA